MTGPRYRLDGKAALPPLSKIVRPFTLLSVNCQFYRRLQASALINRDSWDGPGPYAREGGEFTGQSFHHQKRPVEIHIQNNAKEDAPNKVSLHYLQILRSRVKKLYMKLSSQTQLIMHHSLIIYRYHTQYYIEKKLWCFNNIFCFIILPDVSGIEVDSNTIKDIGFAASDEDSPGKFKKGSL